MTDDPQLLRDFAATRSNDAFAELVRRHLGLVYFTALRQLGGDSHAAQDVAQSVFVDLARKAGTLANHATLTGWLHRSTRYAATKARRAAISRQRTMEGAMRADVFKPDDQPAVVWEKLRPVLDEAVDELGERDRDALLLRFFEGASYAAIGLALGTSEDAARMRVERALEKMRAGLARRGVTSTATALSFVMTEQLATAPSAALAAPIVQAAVAAAAGSVAPAVGLSLFMAQKSLLVAGLVTLAAVSTTVWQWKQARAADATVATLTAEQKSLRLQLEGERQRAGRSNDAIAALQAQIDELKAKSAAVVAASTASSSAAPVPKQDLTMGMARWEIQQAALGNLRQIDAARKQYKLEHGQPAGSLAEVVGRGRMIKTVRTIAGEDYSGISMNPDDPISVTTPGGITVTFDPSGASTTQPDFPPEVAKAYELATRIQPAVRQAVTAYQTAHGGSFPPNEQAIVPYFATPKDGADYIEALEAKKAAGL